MGDNDRANQGQSSEPAGQGNQRPQQGEPKEKEEGNQDSRFAQGGKGDQKQRNPTSEEGNQGQSGQRELQVP